MWLTKILAQQKPCNVSIWACVILWFSIELMPGLMIYIVVPPPPPTIRPLTLLMHICLIIAEHPKPQPRARSKVDDRPKSPVASKKVKLPEPKTLKVSPLFLLWSCSRCTSISAHHQLGPRTCPTSLTHKPWLTIKGKHIICLLWASTFHSLTLHFIKYSSVVWWCQVNLAMWTT
jgi:hypothetical protein